MTTLCTRHANARMAQRGISAADIEFVRTYGRVEHRTGIEFYFLGRRDIPAHLRRLAGHLEGTTLIVGANGRVVVTCYRDRGALGDIKRKSKRAHRRHA